MGRWLGFSDRVDPNIDSGIYQTLSPLKLQVVRLLRKDWEGWHGLQNKAFDIISIPNKNAHKHVICGLVSFHPPAFWKGIVSIQTAGAPASTLVYFE